MPSQELLRRLENQSGVSFRAASAQDAERLAALGLPEEVASFFRSHEPAECAEFAQSAFGSRSVRLLTIEEVLVENEDAVPGVYLSARGWVVFACTDCGDSYCVERASASPVILFGVEQGADFEEMSEHQLRAVGRVVAVDFTTFLRCVVDGTVRTEPYSTP